MPTWLFGIGAKLLGIAIVAVVAFILGAKADNEVWKGKWYERENQIQQKINKAVKEKADADAEERSIEKALLVGKNQEVEEYAEKVTKLSKDLITATTNGARLRDIVIQYANRSRESRTGENPGTSCPVDDTAETLGVLLIETYGVAEEALGDAAKQSEQIEGLQKNIINTHKVINQIRSKE